MKPIASLALGLAAATALFFAGCKPHDHSHDGHDHSGHDHSGHDHGKPATDAKTPADPALAIIEKPTAEQIAAAKPYPLDTCLASGEKLGSMGEPPVYIIAGQQVKLCCAHCLPDLKKDTAKLMAKLAK
jgi:hypothetical protein